MWCHLIIICSVIDPACNASIIIWSGGSAGTEMVPYTAAADALMRTFAAFPHRVFSPFIFWPYKVNANLRSGARRAVEPVAV